MNRREFAKLGLSALALRTLPAHAAVQSGIMSPVLKRGYDNVNSGANLNETVFTQASVAAQGIRKVFTLPMEGDARGCEAQPLIVPSVVMDDGTTRDICIVGSMNNTVWCYDANDSDIMWVKKLAVPVLGNGSIDSWNINNYWGIISTPVIDQATGRIYIVAWTDPNGVPQTASYQMHVLNLKDGSRVCPPVRIEGTSTGQTWNKMMRKQRSSLLMTNVDGKKTVFFGCGTVQETSSGAAGWIIAFDCGTNTVSNSLALSSGEGAGVWMGGSSLLADSSGFLYCVTGNGGFDGVTDFGESVLKIQYTGTTLQVVDHFTPWTDNARDGAVTNSMKIAGQNGPTMAKNLPVNTGMGHMGASASPYAGWDDEDLGSGGMTLTPSGALIVCGKDGVGYVVNSQNMGQTTPAQIASGQNYSQLMSPPLWLTYFPGYGTNAAPPSPTSLDQLWGGKTRHMHSAPVQYNNTIFVWGENSPLRAWTLVNGTLTYLAQGNEIASANVTKAGGGMAGGFMCLSANGATAGTAVLWACIPYGDANQQVTNGRLLAYAADGFVNGAIKVLWDSQAQGVSFLYNKFDPPVVSGGKLFVPNYNDSIDVYAL
jgi:hypothetical protein